MLVTEQLWVDIALRNPLNVPVTLTGLTLVVDNGNSEGSSNDLEVEVIEEIYLNAKELRTVRFLPQFFSFDRQCRHRYQLASSQGLHAP